MEGTDRSHRADSQPTILVVDDDARILAIVAEILRFSGYTVITASGPEQAVQVWEEDRDTIDLVLSDVVMPGIRGPELVARFCADKPTLQAIFMTGYSEQPLEGYRLIGKPFCMSDLQTKVAQALGNIH